MTALETDSFEGILRNDVNTEITPINTLIKACLAGEVPHRGFWNEGETEVSDGLYLAPSTNNDGSDLAVRQLTLLPDTMRLSATNSHHEVTFGNAVIEQGGQNNPIALAIKGFKSDTGAASQELVTTEKLSEMGFNTFRPLAIVKSGDNAFYITETKHYLTGFDSFNWHHEPNQEDYEKTIVPLLDRCADAMTDLAVRGVYHGDMVPKNIIVDEKNDFVFFDFEDTKILDDESEIIDWLNGYGTVENSLAMTDLIHFWSYIVSPYESPTPFLKDSSGEVVLDEFVSNLLSPYMRHLTEKIEKNYGASALEKFDADGFAVTAVSLIAKKLGTADPTDKSN